MNSTPADADETPITPVPLVPDEGYIPELVDAPEVPVVEDSDDDDEWDEEETPVVMESDPNEAPYEHTPHITEFHTIIPWSDDPDDKPRPNYIAVIRDMSVQNLHTVVRAAQMFVKTWDLPGEPRRKRSYDLDIPVMWELYQELKHHFNTVYPETPAPENQVSMTFGEDFSALKYPTLLAEVYRMKGEDVGTIMPVISKSLTGWSLPGDWRDSKYVLRLPAPLLKHVFEKVNAFWYTRLFVRPKK
jgi:hypothetical protein